MTDVSFENSVRIMNSKLTLRMDDELIDRAKREAGQRGKSVSQMVGEFFDLLGQEKTPVQKVPPITSSIRGVLNDTSLSEESYKKHLLDKYG